MHRPYEQIALVPGVNTLISISVGTGLGVGGSGPALSDDGIRLAAYFFSARSTWKGINGRRAVFGVICALGPPLTSTGLFVCFTGVGRAW